MTVRLIVHLMRASRAELSQKIARRDRQKGFAAAGRYDYRAMIIESTIEQDNQGLKFMWGENHPHNIFVTPQIWLLVP